MNHTIKTSVENLRNSLNNMSMYVICCRQTRYDSEAVYLCYGAREGCNKTYVFPEYITLTSSICFQSEKMLLNYIELFITIFWLNLNRIYIYFLLYYYVQHTYVTLIKDFEEKNWMRYQVNDFRYFEKTRSN